MIVIFPEADLADVEQFRSIWDPLHGLVPAHVTLVYPFAGPSRSRELVGAVEAVAARHSPFALHLCDPLTVDQEYLFLVARQGELEIRRLHEDLYQALPNARLHGPFVPHMTIGRVTAPEHLAAARRAAAEQAVSFSGVARAVAVYRIGGAGERTVEARMPLGGS